VRALLFDLDDTLYPRDWLVQSGFAAVAGHVARCWPESAAGALETLKRANATGHAGRELQALCQEHCLPPSAVATLVEVVRAHEPSMALHPAVEAMLRQLRADGWGLAVITNGHPAVQRRKVKALGLDALVDCVVYAEEVMPRGKPHPAVFRKALSCLQADVLEAVTAGDDLVCDILGGQFVGTRTVHVTAHWSPGSVEDGPRVQPDATVPSVLDVPTAAAALLEELSRVF
jgi:putative hydrolase of the HAD superfamily